MYKHFRGSLALGIFAILMLYIFIPQPSWGQTTQDQLVHPSYVAVDSSGYVYVTEPEKHRIQKFYPTGTFITQWGTKGSADGQFNSPQGVATDSLGNVYIADSKNFRIQKFSSSGTFITKWGALGTLDSQFQNPIAITLDANNNVYVTDGDLKRIQVFDSTGTFLRSWGGGIGTGDGQFSPFQGPSGIAVDASGNVYISDTGNNRIQKFTNTGTFIGWAGRCTSGTNCDVANQRSRGFNCTALTCSGPSSGSSDGQFLLPSGLALDSLGNIYVADLLNDRIQKLDNAGSFSAKWGSRGSADGQFGRPVGVAVDSLNNVYVADTGNDRIQKFTNTGTLISVWGAGIRMSASLGEAPGLVAPIVLSPSETQSSMLEIESINHFAGPITLTAPCCIDFNTGLGTTPSGITVQLSSNQVAVPANGSATALLKITTSGSPSFGKFIVDVTGINATLGVKGQIGIVFTVLPPSTMDISQALLGDKDLPPCLRFGPIGKDPPFVYPSGYMARHIADYKKVHPTVEAPWFGMVTEKIPDVLAMMVEESPNLQSDEALVVLENHIGWRKAVEMLNSNNCRSVGYLYSEVGESAGPMQIKKANVTTLVFSKSVCRFWLFVCWEVGWEDVAVFSEPNFWTLFGGRKITFRWTGD